MSIEQIAVNIKDAHGLDMSDEAAITLLRQALSMLAKHGVEPAAEVQERNLRANDGDVWTERYVTWLKRAKHGDKLYAETQLIAAQQKVAEACAKAAVEWGNARKDQYGGNALRNYAEAIRNGDWREYL